MRRLTEVRLDRLKGQTTSIPLSVGTIVTGPNGAGKTAVLEAIRLGLAGRMAGKEIELAARLVGPRGGALRLELEDGASLERGFAVNNEKGTVRESLSISTAEGLPAAALRELAAAEWAADPAVLDLAKLLALAPEGRREYILEACGSSIRRPGGELLEMISEEYARRIGGPGATLAGCLEAGDEDCQAKATAWSRPGGPASILEVALRAAEKTGAAEALTAGIDELKTSASAARKVSKEASAAATELSATSAELGDLSQELEAAREAYGRAKARADRCRTADAKRAQASRALSEAEAEIARLEARRKELGDELGDELEAELGPDPARPQDLDVTVARSAFKVAEETLRDGAAELAGLEAELRVVRSLASRAAVLDTSPVGRLANAAGHVARKIVDREPLPELDELLELVDEVTSEHREAREKVERDLVQSRKPEAIERAIEEHRTARAELEEELSKTRQAVQEAERTHRAALEAWEAEVRGRASTRARRASYAELENRLERATARLDQAEAALELSSEAAELKSADVALAETVERVRAAERALGAYKALEDARQRASESKVLLEALVAATASTMAVRGVLTQEAVEPLLDDADRVLEAAGLKARTSIRWETLKGRPTFELGWSIGGQFRPLETLSGGEAVLLSAALAAALAKRRDPWRILLLEADPLDEENLERLLRGLRAVLDELGNVVLATCREPGRECEGWGIVRLEKGSSDDGTE